MRIKDILSEAVSQKTAIDTISDIIITQIPVLHEQIRAAAKKFYDDHGELGKKFGFVRAGITSRFKHNSYLKYMKPELHYLQKITNDEKLKQFLNHAESVNWDNIEQDLLRILRHLSNKLKSNTLKHSADVLQREQTKTWDFQLKIENDLDTPDEKEPNALSAQNVAAEGVINHILNQIDPKIAGDIRNKISKSANKLQALKQELDKHGIQI